MSMPGHDPFAVSGPPSTAVPPTAAPSPAAPSAAAPPPSSSTRLIGWLGYALLLVLLVIQLVIPTVSNLASSMTDATLLGDQAEQVGMANWAAVLPGVGRSMGFALLAVSPVVVVAMVLGALIGTALPPSSGLAVPARVVVGVTLALFAPLGVGLARVVDARGAGGDGGPVDPTTAGVWMMVTVTMAWLPLLTAGFATAFGAAFAADRGRRPRGLVAVVGGLAVVPAAMQLFDLPQALTGGGPGEVTSTPMVALWRHFFMMADVGRAAAVGAVVVLVVGVLGLVAMLVVLGSRVRLVVTDAPVPRSGVVGLVAVGAVLVGAVIVLLPVVTGPSTIPDGPPSAQVVLNTWAPPAIGAVLQVVVAVAGGAAIGWCRPVGRHSLWLLLPFAPWLFLGPMPLAVPMIEQLRASSQLNTWFSLIPSPTLVVPALVLFALLFAGLRERPGRALGVVGAAAAGALALLTLVQAQSLFRSYAVASSPELWGAPILLLSAAARGSGEDIPLGLLYPVPVLLVIAALGVLAQLGLRRVALARLDRAAN